MWETVCLDMSVGSMFQRFVRSGMPVMDNHSECLELTPIRVSLLDSGTLSCHCA